MYERVQAANLLLQGRADDACFNARRHVLFVDKENAIHLTCNNNEGVQEINQAITLDVSSDTIMRFSSSGQSTAPVTDVPPIEHQQPSIS